MNDIFQLRAVSYSLRSQIDLARPNVNSKHFGISSLRYMAAKVWDMVPNDMKNVNDIETFKNNIIKWKCFFVAFCRRKLATWFLCI